MQAQPLDGQPTKKPSTSSPVVEKEIKPAKKVEDLPEECKLSTEQSPRLPVQSTPNKATMLKAKAIANDLPEEILNSLLPPQNTPNEFMAGQFLFDTECET